MLRVIRNVILSLLCVIPAAAAEPLQVGLINTDRPPYFWQQDAGRPAGGMYIELLNAITELTGIEFSYQFLPQARIRQYMRLGRLDVEPGIDRSWRPETAEESASVYSVPFLISEEVLVFHKDLGRERTLEELQKLRSCCVLGFNTDESVLDDRFYESGQSINQVLDERQMLRMIHKKRCDVALFPRHVLSFYLQEADYDVYATEVMHRYSLRIRLHRRHAALLPQINSALKRLQAEGRLQRITQSYLAPEI